MGKSLSGGTETTTEPQGFIKDAAIGLLERALSQSNTGYMPYAGPVTSGLTGADHSARENMNDAASAFGMRGVTSSMPGAQDFGGGIFGHSSMPLFDGQMDWMQQNRPGQLAHHNSFTIDPVTGRPRENAYAPPQAQQPMMQQAYQQQPNNPMGHGSILGALLEQATGQQQRPSVMSIARGSQPYGVNR